MAAGVTYIGEVVDSSIASSGGAYTYTTAIGVPAGAFLFISTWRNSNQSITSITDSAGSTWRGTYNRTDDWAVLNNAHIAYTVTPRAMPAGSSIVVTWSGSSGNCATICWAFTGVRAEEDHSFNAGGNSATGASNAPSVSSASTLRGSVLLIGRAEYNTGATFTGDTDTLFGTWVEPSSTYTVGTALREIQYKIVHGSAQQTFNGSFAGTVNWGMELWGFLGEVHSPARQFIQAPGLGGPWRQVDPDMFFGTNYGPSSITYLQELLATITATATDGAKQIGKRFSATVTTTPTIRRVIAITRSATVATTATITRTCGKILSSVSATTASMRRSAGKVMSATSSSTASMRRSVGKPISATVTTTPTMTRSIGKRLSSTVSTTASMVRSIGKRLSATVSTLASIAATYIYGGGGITHNKTLEATVTATASITKSVRKFLSAVVSVSPTWVRTVGKRLTVTVTATPSIRKQVGKRMSVTIAGTATLLHPATWVKTLSATITSTPAIVRSVQKRLSATISSTPSLRKSVGKRLSVVVTTTASIRKSVGKRLSATIVANPTLAKIAGRIVVMVATVTSTASLVKSKIVHRTLTATVNTVASFRKTIGKGMTATLRKARAVIFED